MRLPLSQQARIDLQKYVVDHGFTVGDPLPPESELATLLGVGKTSIREAVRSLEALGIVEVRHGRGLYVGAFSFDPIIDQLPYGLLVDDVPLRELLQVRRALEEGLVVEASSKLTEENLRELEEIVCQMSEASADGVVPPALDHAFHQALFAPLENSLVLRLIDVFWQIFEKASTRPSTVGTHTAEDHRGIVEAVRSGDPSAMRRSVALHFTDIQVSLESSVNNLPL